MREYKNAFRILVRERKSLVKSLWCSYFAMVCAAVWCVVRILNVIPAYIVPKLLLQREGFSEGDAYWFAPFPYFEITFVGVGVLLFVITSFWAHRNTLRILPLFSQHELFQQTLSRTWSQTKTTSMITISVILVGVVLMLVGLPVISLFMSGMAASVAHSAHIAISIPFWIYGLAVIFSALAVLALQFVLLLIRFTFLQKQ